MPDDNSRKHWHILVVDDHEENRYLLETMLKRLGHNVTTASNGRQALEMLREDGRDLIISDILMPVMDGYQLCREVRADKNMCGIPFIFYTASYLDKKDEEFAIKLGADRFLRKPMDSVEFVKHLQEFMGEVGRNNFKARQPEIEEEQEILKLYSERLVKKLESKMQDLEQEIIQRKLVEQELKTGKDKYRELVENLNDVIFAVNSDGIITYISPSARQHTGYAPEELVGRPFAGFIHPDDLPEVDRSIRVTLENRSEALDFRYHTKDGQYRWAHASSRPILEREGAVGIRGIFSDITDRKRAGEEIKMLSAMVEQSTDGMAIAGLDGCLAFINDAWCKMHGYKSSKELLGKSLAIFHNQEQLENEVKLFNEKVIELGAYSGEVGHITNDGKPFPTLMATTLLKDEQGKPYAFAGIAKDITELKRAEEALRHSEEKYRSLFENSIIGIYRADPAGRLVMANPTLVRLLGYDSFEELKKAALEDTVFYPVFAMILHRKELREKGQVIRLEGQWPRRDGTPVHIRQSVMAHSSPDGRLESYEGTIEDITQLKLMEEQFLHSQKMEALGRLAGGVAHDFNNVLMAMMSYGDLMLRALGAHDPIRLYALEIQKAVRRAADLTDQLLAFSRKQVLQLLPTQINDVIKDAVLMIRRVVMEDVEISIRLMPDIGMILADAGQITQVLMNLAVNARDAMPQGGVLTIETQNIRISHDLLDALDVMPPGDYVLLQVRDTGCGMCDEVKAHLFEPFYTTKEKGKGTGLGLSTVFGIVKQCKGHIQVESRPGKGTTFKLYLPIIPERPQSTKSLPPPWVPSRGSETVLVVEDEAAVRAVIVEILKIQGYTVLEAINGDEALRSLREHPSPIHLLISDVVMPMMSGVVLAKQIIAQRPAMKVILMSGYMGDEISRNDGNEAGFAFLQKPFSPEVLMNTVQEVLDRA